MTYKIENTSQNELHKSITMKNVRPSRSFCTPDFSSGDFQKGFNAYNKDDFATALREWTPLAEQGDVDAQ